MRIDIDVNMDYQLGGDPMVLLTIEAARTDGQTVVASNLQVQNATLNWIAGEGGLGQRVWACVPYDRISLTYRATVDVWHPALALADLAATPLHELPGDVVSYLRPSRFCQSDMFTSFADRRFGDLTGGAKIAAIRDWVEEELTYVPASSNAATTVLDTFAVREGVCRDYAHLVCALARASNIPARYASVYGVDVDPPDFHAVAQVWLNGAWHLVDATGMCTPDALVVIAVGRDAADIAFMETYAPAQLISQQVTVRRADQI